MNNVFEVTNTKLNCYIPKLITERNKAIAEVKRMNEITESAVNEAVQYRDAVILSLLDKLGGKCSVTEDDIISRLDEKIKTETGTNIDGKTFITMSVPDYLPLNEWRSGRNDGND